MKRSSLRLPLSAAFVLVAALVPACGGSQPAAPAAAPSAAPPAPPPPPPPPVAAAPAATAAPAAAAPSAAPPAPADKPMEHHHHGMGALLLSSVKTLELKPEQKATVEAIEADMEKLGEQHGDSGKQLAADIADGVASGKIDHKKTDADIKAIVKSIEGNQASIQDAVNRLHKALDPDQRKKLVAVMREKGKEMREHMGGMHEGMHEGMHGDHGGPGMEHGGPPGGPGMEHGGPPGGPGMEHGGPPGGPGMEHGGPPGGPGMGGPMHERMHRLFDDLGLTPEQREKIRTKLEGEMKAKEGERKAKMEAAEKHMKVIADAFETDKFDAKKAGVGTQGPEMAKAMAKERLSFVETVLAVLTPDQRAKFAAHVREHAGEGD